MRKISSFSLHFLILYPFTHFLSIFTSFSHSLSIFSQPGCHTLCNNSDFFMRTTTSLENEILYLDLDFFGKGGKGGKGGFGRRRLAQMFCCLFGRWLNRQHVFLDMLSTAANVFVHQCRTIPQFSVFL